MEDDVFNALGQVFDATAAGTSHYIDPVIGKLLEEKGHITLFPEIKDEGSGWIAAQTTSLGNNFVPTKRGEMTAKAAEDAQTPVPIAAQPEVLAELPPAPVAEAPVVGTATNETEFAIHKGGSLPKRTRGRGFGKALYPFAQMELNDFFFIPATAEKPKPAQKMASTASGAAKRMSARTGQPHKFAVAAVKEGQVVGEFTAPSAGAVVMRVAPE